MTSTADKVKIFTNSHDEQKEPLEERFAELTVAVSQLAIEKLRAAAIDTILADVETLGEFLFEAPSLYSLPDQFSELGPVVAQKIVDRLAEYNVPPCNDGNQLLKFLLEIDSKNPGTIDNHSQQFIEFMNNVECMTKFGLDITARLNLGRCIGRCSSIDIKSLTTEVDAVLNFGEERIDLIKDSNYRPEMLYVLAGALEEKLRLGVEGAKDQLVRLVEHKYFANPALIALANTGEDVALEFSTTALRANQGYGLLQAIQKKLEINQGVLADTDIKALVKLSVKKNQWWYVNATAFKLLCQHSPKDAIDNAKKIAQIKDDQLKSHVALDLFKLPLTDKHMDYAVDILSQPMEKYSDTAHRVILSFLGRGGGVRLEDGMTDLITRTACSGEVVIEQLSDIPEKYKKTLVKAVSDFLVEDLKVESSLRGRAHISALEVLLRLEAKNEIQEIYEAHNNNNDHHYLIRSLFKLTAKTWIDFKDMYKTEFLSGSCNDFAIGHLVEILPNTELEQFLIDNAKEALFRACTESGYDCGSAALRRLAERNPASAKRLLLAVAPHVSSFLTRGDFYNVNAFFRVLQRAEEADKQARENPDFVI